MTDRLITHMISELHRILTRIEGQEFDMPVSSELYRELRALVDRADSVLAQRHYEQ
jgi:hypothetical protein